MPSVYTIDGARRTRKKRRKGGGSTAQKKRFAAAAKKCKGRSQSAFRACMKSELRRR